MRWAPFSHQGKTYSLTHLHPELISFEQPAKEGKPAIAYEVEVIYSLHCFTRDESDKAPDPALDYSDSRETRTFDFKRHAFSSHLPKIIARLPTCKCFHTGKGNFFVIEEIEHEGAKEQYCVYFTVSCSSKKGVLNLYVQSAHVKDQSHPVNKNTQKKIGFFVILFNVRNNKPIKQPV